MPDYTESQIRELTGRELRVAVSLLVLGDDMSAAAFGEDTVRWREAMYCLSEHLFGTTSQPRMARANLDAGHPPAVEFIANWRAEPLEMPLEWCVETFYGREGVLRARMSGHSWTGYEMRQSAADLSWSILKVMASPYASERRDHVVNYVPDLRTAIQRAACIVKLREVE